jgi:hypothetical protein
VLYSAKTTLPVFSGDHFLGNEDLQNGKTLEKTKKSSVISGKRISDGCKL